MSYILSNHIGQTVPQSPAVNVQVNIDLVTLLTVGATLIGTLASLMIGIKNTARISKTPLRDIRTRIHPQDLEKDHEIDQYLARILATAKCSRVVVASFTNGTGVGIFPFKYFSILWESVDDGVTEIKYDYQSKPLSKIRSELKLCMDKPDTFTVVSIDDNVPEGCKKYLLTNNIHTIVSRLVGNDYDGYSGIINIQYTNNPGDELPKLLKSVENLFLKLESRLEQN